MKIDEYLLSIKNKTVELIKKSLGELVEFDLMKLPEEIGIFFIYRKDTKELVYIGSACGQNTNIKVVITEYLNPEYTGGDFRNKVIQDIFNTASWVENEIGEEFKNIEQINQSIEYIKENYLLRFIIIPKDISYTDVLLLEKACISLEKPIYNH